jgi:hypothetical protein
MQTLRKSFKKPTQFNLSILMFFSPSFGIRARYEFNHLNVSQKGSQEKNMFADNFGTSSSTSGTCIGAAIQFDYNTKTSTSEKNSLLHIHLSM